MTNVEKLNKWMSDERKTWASLARATKTSPPFIYDVRCGNRGPGPRVRDAIEEFTGGYVKAADWDNAPQGSESPVT